MYSEKSFFENRSRQKQLAFSSYQSTEPMVQVLTKTCPPSEFSAQPLSKLNKISLCMKRCTTTKKTQDSFYDPTKFAIHSILGPEVDLISNCGHNFKKTVSFADILHLMNEENIVTYVDFDYGITFLPGAPTEVGHINRESKTFPGPVKNLSAIQESTNITVLLKKSIPPTSL